MTEHKNRPGDLVTEPLAHGPEPKVNWKLILFAVIGSGLFVMMLMISNAVGKTQGRLECLSDKLTEIQETADPIFEQAEALRREVLEQHGEQAADILNQMLRLADEAIHRAEQEFEEADPVRGGP